MASNTDVVPVLVTAAVTLNTGGTTSITSAAVDTVQNGVKYNRIVVVAPTGTIAATGGLSVFKLQSSATSGGTYADVSNAAATDLLVAADDDSFAVLDIDLIKNGADRYIKLVATTAAAADCPLGTVVAYLLDGQSAPNQGDEVARILRA